ncbi:MAG: transglycosylase SLT domain-containing protein [Bdellovibrionales bacterium]|nr:transglycosylase SLT domain-containing protein [Bdellovibrionales bacterium]
MAKWNSWNLLGCGWVFSLLVACVGPATPFGSIDSLNVVKSEAKGRSSMTTVDELQPLIEFYPDRQVLHGYSQFAIRIQDPFQIADEHSLRVTYDGVDISERFLEGSTPVLEEGRRAITYKWDRLRLPPHRTNKIEFAYLNEKGQAKAYAEYELPDCNMLSVEKIRNTAPFTPHPKMISYLEYWGNEYSYSPTLVAGLVAQESAFNPQAVSWAKAVGLTQVTPLAADEISKKFEDWPRSKNIRRLPASLLKSWIRMGKISSEEDWRLDPERSIQGGYEYLRYLHSYWHKPVNSQVITSIYGKSQERLTEVILASYNSGAYRVKSALKSLGPNYLMSGDLNEARVYVGKVSSYCYHFAKPPKEGS